MLQFAVGFVITHQAAVEGDQNQRHAGTKNGLQSLIKANQPKEASGKFISQI